MKKLFKIIPIIVVCVAMLGCQTVYSKWTCTVSFDAYPLNSAWDSFPNEEGKNQQVFCSQTVGSGESFSLENYYNYGIGFFEDNAREVILLTDIPESEKKHYRKISGFKVDSWSADKITDTSINIAKDTVLIIQVSAID